MLSSLHWKELLNNIPEGKVAGKILHGYDLYVLETKTGTETDCPQRTRICIFYEVKFRHN